ncbi:GIY-YIG nuclease family protein [Bacillus sp. B2-WWTP-C-10-Post-4]|uniref:GIY-YIG nuclease family protein n=1 Tax=Bacillus sp. B2-WWTP-C-10-Post-4 TaxID=2653218 RepID=UPI001869B704|nr:GIY-YIG nuclease family protein [Bacillus sp. B2-WWTP-C-10-Post-4]
MRVGTIYIIKNLINEKIYIGQTLTDIEERWKSHIRRSRDKTKKYKIYSAMRKYGVENFYLEILEENISSEQIDEREIYYISKFNSFKNGYNSTPGGDGKYLHEIDEEEIISKYRSGASSLRIANEYEVSWRTITRTLEKHGVQRRNNKSILDTELFTKDYLSGMPLKDIAEKYQVDVKTVTRERNRLKLPTRMKKERPSIQKPFNSEEFITDYMDGMSLMKMAGKYQVDVKTIGKRRNELKLPKRKEK